MQGKKALVTGGTRGIGLAIASKLAECGIDVSITGRTPRKDLSQDRLRFIEADFTDSKSVDNLCNVVRESNIDILVNNAGINKISSFTEISLTDFNAIQQVNLFAPFLLCQAAIPYMRENKWGRIINITSIFGKISKELRASYSASKFALDGLTVALATEFAKDNILANSVAPGFVRTELTENVLGKEGMAKMAQNVPAGRLAEPNEIAELVHWLCSEANTYLSGQNIAIDGGFTRV